MRVDYFWIDGGYYLYGVDLTLSIVEILSSSYYLLYGDKIKTELFPLYLPSAKSPHFLTMTDLLERGPESEKRDMESLGEFASGRSISESL